MYMDNLQILGFRATINSVEETLNLINSIKKDDEIIQLLNADSIVSKNHIVHGVNQAFLAFERGENLAKDISVETILEAVEEGCKAAYKKYTKRASALTNLSVVISKKQDIQVLARKVVSEEVTDDQQQISL